jgi:hypothetical protein
MPIPHVSPADGLSASRRVAPTEGVWTVDGCLLTRPVDVSTRSLYLDAKGLAWSTNAICSHISPSRAPSLTEVPKYHENERLTRSATVLPIPSLERPVLPNP